MWPMIEESQRKQTRSIPVDKLSLLMSQMVDYASKTSERTFKSFDVRFFKNPFNNFDKKALKQKTQSVVLALKKIPSVLTRHPKTGIMVIALIAVGIFAYTKLQGSDPKTLVSGVASSQTDFSPQIQSSLNKKFEVPIRNASSKETGEKLAITITTIDRSKKILIQGKPATARDTKSFLILNLEIENSTSNQLTIRPVDFIRLQDEQDRSFAPDVHNEEVKAEPISIKKTRVGFVIDETQRAFKFLIGEINGEKETVEVTI